MATLTTEQRLAISAAIQRELSRRNVEIPVGANGVDYLVQVVDDQQEAAEIAVIGGLPNGPGKSWLLNNVAIGREIIVFVESKRLELL